MEVKNNKLISLGLERKSEVCSPYCYTHIHSRALVTLLSDWPMQFAPSHVLELVRTTCSTVFAPNLAFMFVGVVIKRIGQWLAWLSDILANHTISPALASANQNQHQFFDPQVTCRFC